MLYQPGGSAVPQSQQAGNNRYANRQQNYGSGLGGIQQFGQANPYGPYSGLQRGAQPAAGSRTTASTNAGGGEEFLQGVVGGTNLPYSPFTQNQIMGQQTDMTAAAESANLQRMNEDAAVGGASANDPSLQAGQRQLQSTRQNQNLQAQRAISAQAGQANFGAQMDAARALQQSQLTREGWNQQNNQQALGFMPWNQPATQSNKSSYINFLGFSGDDRQAPFQSNLKAQTYEQRRDAYRKTPEWQADYDAAMSRRNYPTASDGYYEMQ